MVYKYADVFCELPRQRFKILSTLVPIYNGMVASIVNTLESVNDEEAEAYFQTLAQAFKMEKDYFTNLWLSKEELSQI